MFEPMSLGDLLDGAFSLFRRHFVVLAGVATVCFGPSQVLNIYATTAGGWAQHWGLLVVWMLVWWVGALIGTAAILRVVSDGYLGRPCTVGEALGFAMSRIGALMLAGFVRSLL